MNILNKIKKTNAKSPAGAKTSNLQETKRRWKEYKLPYDMTGKSFLDVGCWNSGFCVEAKRRGAEKVLGIDMVKSPLVSEFQKAYNFDFVLCDVFSEKYLELPSFDIVFCAGVLYHVENVISLIYRLKIKTLHKLIIETEIMTDKEPQDIPLLRFYPGKELGDNYSNWWVPNVSCMKEMLKVCEFDDVKIIYKSKRRACFHAKPKNKICKKILPRRESFMD